MNNESEDNPTGNKQVSQKLGITATRIGEINGKFNLIMKNTEGIDKALLGIMAEPTLTDEERIFLSYVLGKLVGRSNVKEVIEQIPELLNTAANIGAQMMREEMIGKGGNQSAPTATATARTGKPKSNEDIMYG